MKWIFLLLLISFEVKAACSSISRTNATASSILTSSKLNADLNAAYNFLNSYDGGCIQAGTVEAASLNSTEFGPILKAIVQGCEISYSDSNTISVSKCKIAVDGNLFETSSSNTVTWGCSGCSSEATGSYYVYVKDSSTFTLGISTTAPGKDGYNGTDKAIGAFYNNSLLNIATSSVLTFVNSGFMPTPANIPRTGNAMGIYSAYISASGAVSQEDENFIEGDCSNASSMVCNFVSGFWSTKPKCFQSVENTVFCNSTDTTSSSTMVCTSDTGTTVTTSYVKKLVCIGVRNGI
jgi:hypothetical protein